MSAPQDMHPAKKLKTTETKKVIGTHNGTFHCDEALAVYMLRQTTTYADAELIRTRDLATLGTCDIVVDVGAVYDEDSRRFDHHQRGFEEVFGHGFQTKLSSAGLIYKHFGQEIIASRFQLDPEDPTVKSLWLKLYKEFIEAIDGMDNGVSQYPRDITPKYRSRTDLSARVSWLNPAWNEPFNSKTLDTLFAKASTLAGEEFLGRLDYYAKAWLPARALVADGLARRAQVDPSQRIILFEIFAPWKEHLFELEAEQNVADDVKPLYVVYPDEMSGAWRVQAVPVAPDSFEDRKGLPEAWRGFRDEKLSEVSGIDGGIFVHASGFVGGNKTKDGALALARKALEL